MGTRWYDSDQFVSERKQKKFFRCLSGKKTICPNTFNFTEISFKTLIPGDGWQADEKKTWMTWLIQSLTLVPTTTSGKPFTDSCSITCNKKSDWKTTTLCWLNIATTTKKKSLPTCLRASFAACDSPYMFPNTPWKSVSDKYVLLNVFGFSSPQRWSRQLWAPCLPWVGRPGWRDDDVSHSGCCPSEWRRTCTFCQGGCFQHADLWVPSDLSNLPIHFSFSIFMRNRWNRYLQGSNIFSINILCGENVEVLSAALIWERRQSESRVDRPRSRGEKTWLEFW